MKQFRFVFPNLLFIVVLLTACKGKGNDQKSLLLKKWKMTDITAPMPDSMKKEYLDKSVLEFKTDGNYSITGAKDMTQNGRYKLSDDGKTITFSFANRDDVNDINELTATKLVVTSRLDGYKISAEVVK